MVTRLFLVYLVVELAVLVALVSAIGFGWTVLLLLATFVLGAALAGSQARRQLTRLRSGVSTGRGTVTDGALVALGTVLVVIPGLVTTAAGLLLLLPATRAAARPVLTAIAVSGIGRRAPLVTVATVGAHRYATPRSRGDFIDGEVLDVTDVTDVESPALPAD
ncbi:MAG: FxsA family protein [Mycobacterium sp.]